MPGLWLLFKADPLDESGWKYLHHWCHFLTQLCDQNFIWNHRTDIIPESFILNLLLFFIFCFLFTLFLLDLLHHKLDGNHVPVKATVPLQIKERVFWHLAEFCAKVACNNYLQANFHQIKTVNLLSAWKSGIPEQQHSSFWSQAPANIVSVIIPRYWWWHQGTDNGQVEYRVLQYAT